MRLPITLCVSTRNAARDLAACIESVGPWVSEIVVVDMESSDATLEIARAHGATVVEVPAAGWAEPGRQAGIEAATQPWILVLDADERAGPGIAGVARRYVSREDVAGVWLPRQNFQFGWWVPNSGIWPDWQLRMFRRDHAVWPSDRTHVGVKVAGRCVRAPARLDTAIIHHSFPTVASWIAGMNRYTDLEADRYAASGRPASLARLFAVPLLRCGDLFVRRRGYRGGRYGLAVALTSFCYWLLAELKLWERTLDAERLPRGSVREPFGDGQDAS